MGHELGRALLLSDAVTPDGMSRALLVAIRDKVSLVRALLATDAVDPTRLDEELARMAPDAPFQKHPVPVRDLVDRLPERMCEALLALPVRRDPRTGTIDVALADALDTHAADEIAFYLKAPVRVVRSPLAAIEEGIALVRAPRVSSSPSILPPPPAPGRGAPLVDIEPFPTDHAAHVSERPLPLVKHTSDVAPEGQPLPFELRAAAQTADEIPIPLSRRMFIPRITAQPDEPDDEPVVELRRSKTPSTQSMPAVRPELLAPAPAPPPLHQMLREMARVNARDPLMELVLQAIRPVAPRIALFAAKKEAFVGWMCTPEFGDRAALGEVRVDVRLPSVFATAAATGSFQGPILRNGPHTSLFHFIKPSSPDVVAVAIRAAGKPVVIALAHDLAGTALAMSVMTEVARVAGETLEKIVRSARNAPVARH